jgi:hypothetical protein
MFLDVVINDIRKAGEELSAGIITFAQVQTMSISSEVFKFGLNILSPLIVAYLVHKLKKLYWEPDRPFFRNVIGDIKKMWKK